MPSLLDSYKWVISLSYPGACHREMSWDSNSNQSNQSGTQCLVLPSSYVTSPNSEKSSKKTARKEMLLDTLAKEEKERQERTSRENLMQWRKEELLTAPVTFPPPASFVLPWAICWCTDSTQHLHQHHQQEKRQLPGGHARLWSLHQGYSKESRAMGSAVPLSDIFHTAVWFENTSSPASPGALFSGHNSEAPERVTQSQQKPLLLLSLERSFWKK